MNLILGICATVNAMWSPANQDTFVLPSVAPMFPYPSTLWMTMLALSLYPPDLTHTIQDGTIYSDANAITPRQTDTGHLPAAKHPSEQTDEGTSEYDGDTTTDPL